MLAQLHGERWGHRPWRRSVWRCGTEGSGQWAQWGGVGWVGLDWEIPELFSSLNASKILLKKR